MSIQVAEPAQQRTQFSWPDFPLGLGTSRLCSLNGGLSVRYAVELLSRAFELGVTFIDTAPTYGQGQAETAIGKLAPEVRDRLVLCSKVGYSFGRKAHLINATKPVLRPILSWATAVRQMVASLRDGVESSGTMSLTIEPAAIRSVLEGSLRRMRRDYLDLLLLHDPSVESVDDSANQEQLNRFVQDGKIRAWGVSTDDPAVVKRAIKTVGCSVVQVPILPEWVDDNVEILQECQEEGISIIANSVLSPLSQRQHGDDTRGHFTTAEQCLAFALRQPGVQMVLSGARKMNHLCQNAEIVRRLAPIGSSNC